MPVDLYFAFFVASCLVLLIPGPTVMLVVGYALAEGRQAALQTVLGVALGDLVAMSVSLAGLGALLATSATAFTILKWVGAVYLIYLGIKLWRSKPVMPNAVERDRRRGGRTFQAFVVTVLNPKSIAFFVAFVPQFIAPEAPLLPQMTVMVATFVGLAAINVVAYAYLAGGLRARISKPATLKLINRMGGGVLIGAGVVTAMMRRV